MRKISIYNGSHYILDPKKAKNTLKYHWNIEQFTICNNAQATIIFIIYSASDHIPYITWLFETYPKAIFILQIGENLFRKYNKIAATLSIRASTSNIFRLLFKILYPFISCIGHFIPFTNHFIDKNLYLVLKHYKNTRTIYAVLCQELKSLGEKAVNFPLFSRNIYESIYIYIYSQNTTIQSQTSLSLEKITQLIPSSISNYHDNISTRKKFCCTVFSNTTIERVRACKVLSKIGKVDIFGNNPISNKGRPDDNSAFTSLADLYSQYRFVLCFENSRAAGYVTEKLYNVLKSGAIPIYWGAQDIHKYVNIKSGIFLSSQLFPLLFPLKQMYRKVAYLEKHPHELLALSKQSSFTDIQRRHIALQIFRFIELYNFL